MHGVNKPPQLSGHRDIDLFYADLGEKADFAGGHMPFGYDVKYDIAPRQARYITVMRDPMDRVVSELWYTQFTGRYFQNNEIAKPGSWVVPQVTRTPGAPRFVVPFKTVSPEDQVNRKFVFFLLFSRELLLTLSLFLSLSLSLSLSPSMQTQMDSVRREF